MNLPDFSLSQDESIINNRMSTDTLATPETETPASDAYLYMTPTDPVFLLLRRGADAPAGPYSQEDLLTFLRNGEINRRDFVYYDGMKDWATMDEVFDIQEQLSHFVDDGQNKVRVGEVYRAVSEVLANGEEIFYIGIQEKAGLLSKAKLSVILTNRQMLTLAQIRSGHEIESHPWSSIQNTLIRDDGKGIGTFSAILNSGKRIDVSHIPVAQTHRLFQLAQELADDVGSPE